VFIHSTCLFFIPFLFLQAAKRKLSAKLFALLGAGLVLMIVALPFLLNIILGLFGSSFLTYALERAVRGTTYELEPISATGYIVMLFIVSVLVLKVYWKSKEPELIHFSNIVFFLTAFIIGNLHQVELSTRFFFFEYFFLPFIIPFLFIKRTRLNFLIQTTFSCLFVIFFFYKIEYGVWEYAPLSDVLSLNLFNFY